MQKDGYLDVTNHIPSDDSGVKFSCYSVIFHTIL